MYTHIQFWTIFSIDIQRGRHMSVMASQTPAIWPFLIAWHGLQQRKQLYTLLFPKKLIVIYYRSSYKNNSTQFCQKYDNKGGSKITAWSAVCSRVFISIYISWHYGNYSQFISQLLCHSAHSIDTACDMSHHITSYLTVCSKTHSCCHQAFILLTLCEGVGHRKIPSDTNIWIEFC